MKKLLLILFLFSLSTFSFFLVPVSAQTDTSKHKKAKPYKQGPSYIDAHLYKIQRPQDTIGDTTLLKKKLKLKNVISNIFGPVSADYPPDPKLALENTDGSYFEKPHSVAWFTFVAPQDTDLTLDLQPSQKYDDVDFLLFKDEKGDFLNALASGGAKPVRSNIARCDKRLYDRTGLSKKGLRHHEPPGKHNQYSKPIHVKKGERFYLAVDNYTNANRPFTLFLHFRWPALKAAPNDSVVKVNIIIVDSAGKPLKARLKIAGVIAHKLIDTSNTHKYTMQLKRGQRIKATAIARGYLLGQSFLTVPQKGGEINDTIRLSPVKAHGNMVLQDIQFEPAQAIYLQSSLESLNTLLDFMKSNPTVHILIKGYVNDPEKINTDEYDQDLSERRAKAVLKYLTDNGIDASRLEWKGFGTSDLIYQHPETTEEQEANRRVEIEIK